MKKHIIIAGVPRAGKSTISSLISKAYGYQHISMDSIIAGFECCFPDLGINTYADMSSMEILFTISGKIAPFINAMMKSGEYDELSYGMVIDIYQLLPSDYVKFINRSVCDIFYFVTADVTPEERFEIQVKYDTPKDYTFYISEEEKREGCVYIVEQSKLIKEQCLELNLPCYETSKDRENVFDEFLKSLT